MLTEEQIKHVAKLAKLELTGEEVKKFQKQLSEVLNYFNILDEVDTDKIVPTSQVTGLENVTREDVVENDLSQEKKVFRVEKII